MKKRIYCLMAIMSLVILIVFSEILVLGAEASTTHSECLHTFYNVHEIACTYPNANDSGHQKRVECVCVCKNCHTAWYDTYSVSEPHTIDSSTNKCVCGYQPRHWSNM